MTKDTPIVEQLIIENTKSTQTQLQASDILKTKQLIPHNFIQLETKAKNYMCSTEGWKEPVCERFGFTYEGKWIQLDIPHEVMEKLELSKGESISYPVYVSSELLNKEPEFGGITLEKEDEMFLLKPLTKDEEVQTEVSGEDIKSLEKKSEEKDKQIAQLNQKVEEQARKIRELEIIVSRKERPRDWRDFYKWLLENVIDENHSGYIKSDKRTKYPVHGLGDGGSCFPYFIEGIKNFLGEKETKNKWGGFDKRFVPLSYNEDEIPEKLLPEYKAFSSNYWEEIKNIIKDWKSSTSKMVPS